MNFRTGIMWKTAKATPPSRRSEVIKVSKRFIGQRAGFSVLALWLIVAATLAPGPDR